MPDTTFAPGTVIADHSRLWRMDAHKRDEDAATYIAGGEAEQSKLYPGLSATFR